MNRLVLIKTQFQVSYIKDFSWYGLLSVGVSACKSVLKMLEK